MVKEKRILSNYIGRLILGLFFCFIGIKNTYASEISQFDFMGKDFNSFWIEQNSSISGTLSVTVSDITQIKPYINIIIASTYEPNFLVTSNNYFTDTWTRKLYSYGTTTVSGYNANVYVIQFSTKGLNNWNCSVDGTNCYVNTNIRMTGPSDYSAVFQLRSISLTDIVLDDDYLKNITVNQNNEIIDQNQTMIDQNQSIIQGQEKLEDAIIDSNKETQDVIKDQFNNCRDSYQLIDFNNVYSVNSATYSFLDDNLTVSSNFSPYSNIKYDISNLVKNNPGKKIRLDIDSLDTSNYNSKDSVISQLIINFTDNTQYIHILNKDGYSYTRTLPTDFANITSAYLGIYSNNSVDSISSTIILKKPILHFGETKINYEPYGEEICTNKLDEQNDALNNIGGALTDDSPTDMSGLGDSAGWLPAGPVDSILTLPLTLFTTLSDNLSNNTCTTAVLPLPFVKKNINLPCIKTLYDKIGITGTLFTTAGIIASCFILFNYLLSLYNWVDKTLTMRENTMPGYYDDNWGGGA